MLKINLKSAISTYFICNFLFWLVSNVNYNLVSYYFEKTDLSLNELSMMNYYRMIGVGVSAFFLVLLYSLVDVKKLLIFSLTLYLISQINLILSNSIEMVRLYYLLLSTASGLLIFLLLGLTLMSNETNEEMSLTMFFGAVVLAFVVSDVLLDYVLFKNPSPNLNSIMSMNIIPIFIIISIIVFNNSIDITRIPAPSNFVNILRYMELESLQGFVLFFIIMIVVEGNDVYEVTNSLVYLTVNDTRYYMAIAMLTALYPIAKLMVKYKNHTLNLINITIATILFGTLPIWTNYIQFGFVCWVVIALIAYQILVNNILLIFEKFDHQDRFSALIIYFIMCTLGLYSGYFTILAMEETLGQNAFTYSITIVLATIFLYYLYRFIKDKLYRW